MTNELDEMDKYFINLIERLIVAYFKWRYTKND
jgi:hypothetical protein